MCLTIPARILKLNKKNNTALVSSGAETKTISVSLIPRPRVGDWVLYINDWAEKKIAAIDAREIANLLESPSRKIPAAALSTEFKKIIERAKSGALEKAEIVRLLSAEGKEKQVLFSEADITRRTNLKDFICIHGIIEFSNHCANDCRYCGLRAENRKIQRYRMSPALIVRTAERAVREKGYKLLVLQSGEDHFYTDKILCRIIKEIKKKCRVFIFMSVGERGYACYKKMKAAGAAGVLLRFETANTALFKNLHQRGKTLKNRLTHLRFLRKLGYFVATGSLIGLPGQTVNDLAQDILITKSFANMASVGPFLPADHTPLSARPNNNEWKQEITLKMIAVLRLLLPTARIPVTTALETLAGEAGRKQALLAGANSLMLNLTPDRYRPLYRIYDDKFHRPGCLWEKYGLFKQEESYQMLAERINNEINKKKCVIKR